MKISMIAAIDSNNVIGCNNTLPWKLPEDLAYFKKVTMGHPIIMGRRTHEAIGKPLPGRRNIILTRNRGYKVQGCEIIHSIEALLSLFANFDEEIFVIGGEEIFRQLLKYTTKLYITKIEHKFKGDTFFPSINPYEWDKISVEKGIFNEDNPYEYYYVIYERKI